MSTLTLAIDRTQQGFSQPVGGGDSSETGGKKSVHVTGSSNSGTWTAKVRVYGANDARFPVQIFEFDISNTTPSDAGEITFKWEYFCMELVSVTGTATKVSAVMSV